MPLRTRLPSAKEVALRLLALGKRALPGVLLLSCTAGILLGGYHGYQWFTHSPRFAIDTLKISGNARLSPADIAGLLQLPANPNIFQAETDDLEAKLLTSPWVHSVEISRTLPDTLEIELQEERAVAVVDLEGFYLVNIDGHPFKRTLSSSEEMDGLPILTGFTRDLYLGSPDETQEQIVYALTALKNYSQNADRPSIGELHTDSFHGITLITYDDAIAIHIGMPPRADFEDRFVAFDAAWQALGREEHAAARAFRIADRTPSDRVTVAFAGN